MWNQRLTDGYFEETDEEGFAEFEDEEGIYQLANISRPLLG
jgi:hypothetical protein